MARSSIVWVLAQLIFLVLCLSSLNVYRNSRRFQLHERLVGLEEIHVQVRLKRAAPQQAKKGILTSFESNELSEKIFHVQNLTAHYAKEAFEELERRNGTIECIPQFCARSTKMRKERGDSLVLASVPGSGNTWLRSILRYGTRVYTGSVYKDKSLFERGFKGEMISPSRGKTLVVKSHFPYYKDSHTSFPWAKGGIHVVRAPFDAGLADCKRRYTGTHTADMRPRRVWNLCPAYISKRSQTWNEMLEVWEGSSELEKHEFANFEDNLKIRAMNTSYLFNGKVIPIIGTMWYEDFKRDFVGSLVYLFSFLKAMFPEENLPPVVESVSCVVYHHKSLEKALRAPKLEITNVFRNNTGSTTNRLGAALCEDWKPYWNIHKWGVCNGLLQKQRTDTKPVQTRELRFIDETKVCRLEEQLASN